MSLVDNVAMSLRTHLTQMENGKQKLAATDVVITPSTEYRLSTGRAWHITDRQWARLSEVEGHVMAHTALQYIDNTTVQYIGSFPVNIYRAYAQNLRAQIQVLARTARYERYTLGSFVAWLPMRISHSSPAMIVLDRDIMTYAAQLKLRPVSYHERGKVTPSMSQTANTVELTHYYKGKRIDSSEILLKGRFQMFGFDFNSVEEAYEGLSLLLESGSVKSSSRIVIPQLKDYNEKCVLGELRQVLTEVGQMRGETLRVKAPKIITTHFDVDVPNIPDPSPAIPDCFTLSIPPC